AGADHALALGFGAVGRSCGPRGRAEPDDTAPPQRRLARLAVVRGWRGAEESLGGVAVAVPRFDDPELGVGFVLAAMEHALDIEEGQHGADKGAGAIVADRDGCDAGVVRRWAGLFLGAGCAGELERERGAAAGLGLEADGSTGGLDQATDQR